MNLKESIKVLEIFQGLSVEESQHRKKELNDAFRVFWSYGPTEAEFAIYISGVLYTPEISYIMATEPCGGFDEQG